MIRLSIRRPVAVAMAYLTVALLGVAAWRNIPLELLPGTELPRLTIRAQWVGASPEATEAFLTSPLEAAVQQVRGIETITSESGHEYGAGTAKVEARFARGTDMDFARLEISERLAALEDDLPPSASRPQVLNYVPEEFKEQDRPFLSYTVTGPFTLETLRQYVDDRLLPDLVQMDGVAAVVPNGGRARLLEIELSDTRIEALGLSPDKVRQAVRDLEIVQQAGRISRGHLLHTLALRERAESAAEVRGLPLLSDQGRLVRLGDVARVHDTYEEPRAHYRIDAQPAVSFTVYKELGTNAVAVADRVKAHLAALEGSHPPGVRLILDDDESEAIRAQLSDLRVRALVAAAIVFAVLLLFLRSWRSAALAFTSMAAAVLITLNLIYFAGLTLNVLTLMGLAMGFGMIIDNSIVVLDNIFRHRANGRPAQEAAERGAREVTLPILAATLTTLVVLIPFVYLQGELRVYYVPLAIVVALTNLASLFVSFSLVPALAWRSLRRPVNAAVQDGGSGASAWYVRLYAAMTGWTLSHPWVTVALAVAMLGGSYYLFDKYVTRGVVWGRWGGNDTYIAINITLPRGEELGRTDEIVRHFEERLRAMPEVERFVSRVNPQYATMRVTFPDSIAETWVPVAIKEQMVAYSHGFGGAEVRVYGYGPSFYGGGSSPPNYSIQVLGYNYQTVRDIAEDLSQRLLRFSRIQDVDPNASGRWYDRDKATELVLQIDRERLGMHGLSARDVVSRVRAAVAGSEGRGSVMRLGGEEVHFAVKLAGHDRLDLLALHDVLIPSASGAGVRLGDIATVAEREVQPRILREDQQYQRTVAYEFRGPTKLGDRVRDAVVASTRLPPGYRIEAKDRWSWSEDEKEQIYGVLAVSLLLVFMVCAALFESIRQPLVVLLSVPMALIGVFLVFFYANASFTREAYIGVIMMGGVVVNNAILLVDHINALRRRAGVAFREAILQGTLERVRPILMTTTTTVLGLLPLVLFSESADANIWNALGYALIGGLTSSTFLILTVTPALYLLFERGVERRPEHSDAAAAVVPPDRLASGIPT
jgi:HAE1 family hydrophobic/amphiphilic exporter-1